MTVIIPARPDEAEVKAAAAARQLEYPKENLEILVARGRQPSVQRNLALKTAAGEFVYFLDDDSLAAPGNIRRALQHFSNPEVQMVGGPNLCPANAPSLEQSFALVMGSWLAFGPSRARYRSVGEARESSEKELILCNLFARRSSVVELGGFNEKLYPNEENALMDQLQQRGGKLIYDPELIVERRPRPTWKAFMKMLLNYGRGRAEQFRAHPTPGSILNFVPPLFCVYLIALPILSPVCYTPLGLYFIAVVLQSLVLLPLRKIQWLPRMIALIFLSHVFYGVGFWRGLFTRPAAPSADIPATVKLEKLE